MTSNQIANASNMIQERNVAENERHNQAVEEETKRHNLVTEDLTAQAQRIESERAYWDAWYKQQSTYLQREYNDWYKAWTEASGRRKLEIEAMLANIKQQEADTDQQYKYNLTLLNDRELDLKSRAQGEIERANKEAENLKRSQQSIDWYGNWIREKQADYQNSYWNAAISLGNLEAVYKHEVDLGNLDLGWAKLTSDETIALTGFKRDQAKLESEKKLINAQAFNYYLQGIGNLFGSASRLTAPWAFGK